MKRALIQWLKSKTTISGIGVLVTIVVTRLPVDAEIKAAMLPLLVGIAAVLISNIGEK